MAEGGWRHRVPLGAAARGARRGRRGAARRPILAGQRHRLRALRAEPAGDWARVAAINAGCMEVAVMAGFGAAAALAGVPDDTYA